MSKEKSKKKEKHEEKTVKVEIKESQLLYEKELVTLQIELLKMQNHIKDTGKKLLLIFEGRDAAGKGAGIQIGQPTTGLRQYRIADWHFRWDAFAHAIGDEPQRRVRRYESAAPTQSRGLRSASEGVEE